MYIDRLVYTYTHQFIAADESQAGIKIAGRNINNLRYAGDTTLSLGLQVIQPVHSEGDQPWDFFGRTDAKAETPVLWPPHAKS